MPSNEPTPPLPGQQLDYETMPGHWVLANLGKRVLRPGGLELTHGMLDALDIGELDDVVEFAPGLGETTRLALAARPSTYVGVERDEQAADIVRGILEGDTQRCIVGHAGDTNLPSDSASVVYGEAMLTMETRRRKREIVAEAQRLLRPGGRYAIHELCLLPDDLGEDRKNHIQKELARAIRVNARPLTPTEWRDLMTTAGFVVEHETRAPMHLLAPRRFVRDEGIAGTLRFVSNVARSPKARKRLLGMRSVFGKYADHLAAIAIVGTKPGASTNE